MSMRPDNEFVVRLITSDRFLRLVVSAEPFVETEKKMTLRSRSARPDSFVTK